MDLFVVNRYLGDEEHDDKFNETKKLNKVLNKIKKRKRERENTDENITVDHNLASEDVIENVTDEIIVDATEVKDENPLNDSKRCKIDLKGVIDDVSDEELSREEPPVDFDTSQVEGFTVLGNEEFTQRRKVKRVLPKWLTEPTIISSDLQNLNKKIRKFLVLDEDLKAKLKKNGIRYLFPVQETVIPWILKEAEKTPFIIPQDICVSSPTGSGKTLAFALPIIQILKTQLIRKVRALIILPTQGLAVQIYNIFKDYSEGTNLTVALITGNRSFPEEQQQLVYKNVMWGFMSKVDIIVCTPGRLVDHLKLTEGFSLRSLQFIVVDEADRVLDNVQDDWLNHLEDHLKINDQLNMNPSVLNSLAMQRNMKYPQKLLFSATLSQDPEKIQKLSLFQPKLFTAVMNNENEDESHFIGKYTTPNELIEKYIECSAEVKPLVLYKYIIDNNLSKVLIFTSSIQNVHRLRILLHALSRNKLTIKEISSTIHLEKRKKLMKSFSDGEIDVLVCTDAMARGVDLPNVSCVISYSTPKHLRTYIHRIGRTARAGEQGLAVTILQPTQKEKFFEMLQQADKKKLEQIEIAEEELEPLTELYQNALEDLKVRIHTETKRNLLKKKKQNEQLKNKHRKKKLVKSNKTNA